MRTTQASLRGPVRRTLAVAIAAWLAGCTVVGPDYVKPEAEVPAAFREAAGADRWKDAAPADREARGPWWEAFGDATLNALEVRVAAANQTLAVAESQFRQARALAQVARAGYLPTVGAGASASHFRRSENAFNNTSRNIGPSDDYTLGLDLAWEADVWGRVRRSVEAAEAGAQSAAADLGNLRLSLQAELAIDYFLVRSIDAERDLLDRTVVAYRKALDLTTQRYRGGIAPASDVAQAETQYQSARARAVDLGVQRAQLEHAIAVLVGAQPSAFRLAPATFDATVPPLPTGLPSALLERRPDIASAERQMAAANARIGVARAAYYPTLRIGASAGLSSTNPSDWLSLPSRFWAIGPSAFLTLFDGGRRRALNEQAAAAWDGSVAAYRQTVLSAFADVEDNLAALRVLAEEAELQDAAVQSARKSVDISTRRYEAGAASYLDVVVAQSAALVNERAAVDVARRRKLAGVRLIKALGGDWKV